MTKATYCAVL